MIFKVPLSGGALILLLLFSQALNTRVQSPLERWPSMISMNRPKMESRPYEFLLQYVGVNDLNNKVSLVRSQSALSVSKAPWGLGKLSQLT